jgi:hypothetical protein
MECSICKLDESDGVIKDGKVICKRCERDIKNKKKEGKTYYSISHRLDKLSIIEAKYKETDNYFIKIEADRFWPRHEDRIKKYFGSTPGGYKTIQEAINTHYRNLEYQKNDLEEKLTRAIKRFSEFQDFITDNGYSIPTKENIDIEI